MEKDKEKTIVIFRQFRKGGDIIAFFPELPGDLSPLTCLCYQFIGQHGAADYYGLLPATRPCNLLEAAALHAELESLGYNLDVKTRLTLRMYAERCNTLKRFNE